MPASASLVQTPETEPEPEPEMEPVPTAMPVPVPELVPVPVVVTGPAVPLFVVVAVAAAAAAVAGLNSCSKEGFVYCSVCVCCVDVLLADIMLHLRYKTNRIPRPFNQYFCLSPVLRL